MALNELFDHLPEEAQAALTALRQWHTPTQSKQLKHNKIYKEPVFPDIPELNSIIIFSTSDSPEHKFLCFPYEILSSTGQYTSIVLYSEIPIHSLETLETFKKTILARYTKMQETTEKKIINQPQFCKIVSQPHC